jgi:HJR/Mrr/RecB family endonuclease
MIQSLLPCKAEYAQGMVQVISEKKMSAGIIFFCMTNGARTVVYRKCAIQKVQKMNGYCFCLFSLRCIKNSRIYFLLFKDS